MNVILYIIIRGYRRRRRTRGRQSKRQREAAGEAQSMLAILILAALPDVTDG